MGNPVVELSNICSALKMALLTQPYACVARNMNLPVLHGLARIDRLEVPTCARSPLRPLIRASNFALRAFR